MPAIRAAVFDIGAVLFVPHSRPEFFARWSARIGIPAREFAKLLWYGPDIEAANIGAISAEEYGRRCASRLQCEEAVAVAIIEDAFAGASLNHQLANHIASLRPRLQIAALSNHWSFGRGLIEKRGITALFDQIVLSAEEGVRKPDPRIYGILLDRLRVTPDEVVFVDDTAANIAAAVALGMHGIQFRSTGQAIADLDNLVTRCNSV